MRTCVVFIPAERGGSYFYEMEAASAFDAARQAISAHEKRHPRLANDAIVRVVLEGKNPLLANCDTHNAGQPNYRVMVGRVRLT